MNKQVTNPSINVKTKGNGDCHKHNGKNRKTGSASVPAQQGCDLKSHDWKRQLGTFVRVHGLTQSPRTDRTIVVKKVDIIPQVLGSLVAMSREAGLMDQIKAQQNLTIDVGYGTLQSLVTDGFVPVAARSDGNMGGVSKLLQKVARDIYANAATNINFLNRIDTALLQQQPSIKVYGEDVLLAEHHAVLSSAAEENLNEMMRTLGDTIDIDNIFLAGGGAHLYESAITAAFPKRKLHITARGSRFTNVRGFQFVAETEN